MSANDTSIAEGTISAAALKFLDWMEEQGDQTTMKKSKPKRVIVIPARMDSGRLPGKPMLEARGWPLVRWTYERAKRTRADHVMVTSPDRVICDYCQANGMVWFPSSRECPTGTHRCAEALECMSKGPSKIGLVVNWQVDSPLVDPQYVNCMMERMTNRMTLMEDIVTLVARSSGEAECPNVTKVAVGTNGRAFWFSRSAMAGAMVHCGVYGFLPSVLKELGRKRPTPLSCDESLEQLTWIENDFEIQTIEMNGRLPLSIDAPRDWEEFKMMVENCEVD